jgi:excisionase family DNA binding protein
MINVQFDTVELAHIIEQVVRKVLSERPLQNDVQNEWLNINELSEYLPDKPVKATIYSWVQNNSIPHHKGGKKLRFLKSEIDQWLRSGKKKLFIAKKKK